MADVSTIFYLFGDENINVLQKPITVWMMDKKEDNSAEDDTLEFLNPLGLEQWLEHIKHVFNCREAYQLVFGNGSENINLEIIRDTFGHCESLWIETNPANRAREILGVFQKDLKELKLRNNPFLPGDNEYQKLLLQNFKSLELGFGNRFERLTLDDLLICNAVDINLSPVENFEGINRFLKLWIKGSNPQLHRISIKQRTEIPKDVLKGIQVSKWIKDDPIETEVEIYRVNGTKATISMKGLRFSLFVEIEK
ncbi:hypothetical protein CAEBREN_20120 [Caenorhabditis brenneri]|uniref:Sdz-33 F-box domain-containing protein n=1 Tax=Caenorhabditis brenneri TaxID=135651 RepID=G0ND61_CAEBE|nr:hypothetical protein CAEBREN_20120 [Caenorhabditis brenneri]